MQPPPPIPLSIWSVPRLCPCLCARSHKQHTSHTSHTQVKALGGSLLLTGAAAAGCFWVMQDLGLVNPDSPTSSKTLATAFDILLRPQAAQQQAQQELAQQQQQRTATNPQQQQR